MLRSFGVMILIAAVGGSRIAAAETVPAQNAEALALLTRMAESVSSLQHFSYKIRAGYDVVQKDGQKIEFLESRNIVINRPDHVRCDYVQTDGSEGSLSFDGKELTLYNKTDNASATTATAGSIDDAIEVMSGKLGIRMPLAMLISTRLPEMLRSNIKSADVVETTTLDGATCVHLAARGERVDLQVWLPQDQQQLPRRIVITYKLEKGMPEYRADLSEWKVEGKQEAVAFDLAIPADADKMEFHAVAGRKGTATGTARTSQGTEAKP